IEALDMLDVQRRVDRDARAEQLLDVLPAPRMARARRVRVRELRADRKARPPFERAIEVELLDARAAIVDRAARQKLETLEPRGGLGAAVRLDEAHDDIDARPAALVRLDEHRVRLADAGGGAEEDLELRA